MKYCVYCIQAALLSVMSVMGAHTWVMCCAAQEEEMTDSERRFKAERAGGNYSQGTKEMQEKKIRPEHKLFWGAPQVVRIK